MVSALCHALEEMCHMNDGRVKTKSEKVETAFYAAVVPSITLKDFLMRIAWFYGCTKECFVLALEYIHRIVKDKSEIVVNYNTAYHLVLTCIKVAAKFLDDMVFNNKFFAHVTGLPAVNIAVLEIELLFRLSFDLFVLPEQYQNRYSKMMVANKGFNKVTISPGGIRKC